MKNFAKFLLVGGAAALASTTQAATISIYDDAEAAEAVFLADALKNTYIAQEKFNGPLTALGTSTGANYVGNFEDTWEHSAQGYNTAVGTFELVTAGQNTPRPTELKIESELTGESGREIGPEDFWLDSNDAEVVTWTLGAPLSGEFNAFGFYLFDSSDIGADLSVELRDKDNNLLDIQTIYYPQPNGNAKYVTVTSAVDIFEAKITFTASENYDGWGFDNATVGKLPEPGTLLLMGLGLLGLGAARRRAAK